MSACDVVEGPAAWKERGGREIERNSARKNAFFSSCFFFQQANQDKKRTRRTRRRNITKHHHLNPSRARKHQYLCSRGIRWRPKGLDARRSRRGNVSIFYARCVVVDVARKRTGLRRLFLFFLMAARKNKTKKGIAFVVLPSLSFKSSHAPSTSIPTLDTPRILMREHRYSPTTIKRKRKNKRLTKRNRFAACRGADRPAKHPT